MAALKLFVVALITLAVMDVLWLGVFMRGFYRAELAPIARLAPDGSLAPIWSAALPVYALIAIGIVAFVVPRATAIVSAFGWGALSGLIVFGVYDLTNLATLRGYSLKLTIVDICWGMTTSAVTAAVVKAVGQR